MGFEHTAEISALDSEKPVWHLEHSEGQCCIAVGG